MGRVELEAEDTPALEAANNNELLPILGKRYFTIAEAGTFDWIFITGIVAVLLAWWSKQREVRLELARHHGKGFE